VPKCRFCGCRSESFFRKDELFHLYASCIAAPRRIGVREMRKLAFLS
jgi:hypothetical protein